MPVVRHWFWRSALPRYAATLWGFVVFMPVGVTYAAATLLFMAMLACGRWHERAARLRASPIFWPWVAYVAWTLVVLAIRPHYPQTGENLAHGLRIALTMAMAVMLTREEAVGALRGFIVVAAISVLLIVLKHTVGLPDLQIWRSVTIMTGNKSINNALLFALLGATAAVFGLAYLHRQRRWFGAHGAVAAFAMTLGAVLLVRLALPSRTSLIGLALAVAAACIHQWRKRWDRIALALIVVAAVVALGVWKIPAVQQQQFASGLHELEQAQAGTVSEDSWVSRFYMYRITTQMMLEKPVAGWGIGAWTSQWKARAPAVISYKNMPHDDFLWMGAQAGIPGFVVLLAILLAGLWGGWRRADLAGRLGFVAMLTLLTATSVNSALRDAQIGLALPWIAFVYLRLSQEAGHPWSKVLPGTLRPASGEDAAAAGLSAGAQPPRPL
ncbi:MAG: O-antigen ligase family protein [Burkholderiaceae bacterium]|jgi:O-antigen ligase|nr:O-antigen ligase family protein [Burkholderiaceae bacterium]